jgi:hypothetical protein
MSEENKSFGSGILKGLKRMLFTDEPAEEKPVSEPVNTPPPANAPQATTSAVNTPVSWPSSDEGSKESKLKVYQLLESMNKQGIDFFEVWNASTEMGGISPANIKAAFTSLRFADKSLNKAKLLETGTYYMTNLQNVLKTETQKRLEEKSRMDKEKEQVAGNLASEITSLEQQIATLQEKLAAKKEERDTINEKYEPRIADINNRIQAGQQSVNSVLSEMQQVMDVIQKEIS